MTIGSLWRGVGLALKKRAAFGIGIAATVLLAACSPVYTNHGYVPDDTELAQLEIGKTTREEVATIIGRPASQGVLAGSDWYFVGSRWVRKGITASKEIDRQVVAVSFNAGDTVSNVERFGLQDGEVIVISRRVTDSGIKGVTFIRQLMSSFGRVSTSQFE